MKQEIEEQLLIKRSGNIFFLTQLLSLILKNEVITFLPDPSLVVGKHISSTETPDFITKLSTMKFESSIFTN